MADIRSLREEALKRHRAAGRKVARLKRERGVNVAGTEFDPRIPVERLKRYNARQLETYIERVNQFTRRSVQFVPDYRGRPMRGGQWQQYKDAERRYNQYVQRRFQEVKDIVLPTGMTVGERMATITPSHPVMGEVSVSAPYNPVNRRPRSMSAPSLEKMAYDLRRRMEPGARLAAINRDRATYRKMLAVVGDHELDKAISQLSDKQFELLWNYTDFAASLGMTYESIRADLTGGNKPSWMEQVAGDAHGSARQLVEWAGRQNVRS